MDDILSDKITLKYSYLSNKFPEITNKDKLYEEYITNLSSLPMIRNKYSIDYKNILFLLSYFNIEKRTVKESCLIGAKRQAKTNIVKYGVKNVSQIEEVKIKKENTFIKNYGVNNIWKTSDYRKISHEIMINKYGKGSIPDKNNNQNHWGWKHLNNEDREKRIVTNLTTYGTSSLEKRIQLLLLELKIIFTTQFKICNYYFDISVANTNIILEINGDYWHGNPIKYEANDLLSFPNGYVLVEDLWKKDENKKNVATKEGYKVFYLWESEIQKSSNEDLKSKLRKIIYDQIF